MFVSFQYVYTQLAATNFPISKTMPIIIIGMTAAENIVVNPKIEYHAATPAIAIDVRNVNIDIFISSIYVEPLS